MKFNLDWCCKNLENWVVKLSPTNVIENSPMHTIAHIGPALFCEINDFKLCPFCGEEFNYELYEEDKDI